MGANSYKELRKHIGHKLECVCYGIPGREPANIAIECVDCKEVLLDFDEPDNPRREKHG